nr:MAG TPA: hypothetical protein [Caudoviricetes sp.]
MSIRQKRVDNSVVLYTVSNWCYGISTFFRGIRGYQMGI